MRIVAISSWVGFGHVGLSAATPALTCLGREVAGLPTVVLSNHPGWPHFAGQRVDPQKLLDMLDALDSNGWLADADAVLTGYLPSPAHVTFAVHAIERVRARSGTCQVVVDPVLGDRPKGRYIAQDAAEALRDRLVPCADILTPNVFELGWLLGREVETRADAELAIAEYSQQTGLASMSLTSAPVSPDTMGVMELSSNGLTLYETPRYRDVPHGVGDVFAAFVAAGFSSEAAVNMLHALISESLGADHLRITETAQIWMRAAQES